MQGKKLRNTRFFLSLQRVSLIRPAPAELPQVRKEARVGGCSGAICGLPFFFCIFEPTLNKKSNHAIKNPPRKP
jgi:hypothetical protein